MAKKFEVGVIFPYSEIEIDPGKICGFARAVEAMGYDYFASSDHVIGVSKEARPDFPGHYDAGQPFFETLMLFSHLAAVTRDIQFISALIVSPQRQTALLAQQAANLDIYCGGRLKLGFGTGWNQPEYESLGVPFEGRGLRLDDQIEVLRGLWSKPWITHKSDYHHIDGCGLSIAPIQRPIPIIVGGNAEPAMRRAARLGDGWMPFLSAEDAAGKIGRYQEAVAAAGRDPDDSPLYNLVHMGTGLDGAGDGTYRTPEQVAADIVTWRDVGARAILINTMERGLVGADAHLEAVGRIAELLGLKSR